MSGIFGKIATIFKGKATEAGQEYIDNNAITLLKQELREAEQEVNKAEADLASTMADEARAKSRYEEMNEKYKDYENKAMAALDAGEEELANEVAVAMAEMQGEIEEAKATYEMIAQNVSETKRYLKDTRKLVDTRKREIKGIESRDKLNKAQERMAGHATGATSKVSAMNDTLSRLKEKQEHDSARIAAAKELRDAKTGESLEQKLKAAGIGSTQTSANSILESLKNKKSQ